MFRSFDVEDYATRSYRDSGFVLKRELLTSQTDFTNVLFKQKPFFCLLLTKCVLLVVHPALDDFALNETCARCRRWGWEVVVVVVDGSRGGGGGVEGP